MARARAASEATAAIAADRVGTITQYQLGLATFGTGKDLTRGDTGTGTKGGNCTTRSHAVTGAVGARQRRCGKQPGTDRQSRAVVQSSARPSMRGLESGQRVAATQATRAAASVPSRPLARRDLHCYPGVCIAPI